MSPGDSVRLFAALELPGAARAALAGWAARVAGQEPAVRLVPVGALHVTLVFLGRQEQEDLPAIARAVTSAASPIGPLEVQRAAWLPPRHPGVLVADLDEAGTGGALAALQADLVAGLEPWHEPETRGFRPHVTVARMRRGQRPSTERPVAAPPVLSFVPSALVLYRSLPGAGGPHYEMVASAPVR